MPAILIVDNHVLIRQGLKQVIGRELRDVIYGEAADGDRALAQITKRPWDLVILGISLPGNDGSHLLAEIRKRRPETRVLVVSMHNDSQHATRAHRLGALGYVSKDATCTDLMRGIRSVLSGKRHFDGFRIPEGPGKIPSGQTSLSVRERRVMSALASGKRVSEIASDLGLSIKTVSTYKRRVFNKLKINSIAELVRHTIGQN